MPRERKHFCTPAEQQQHPIETASPHVPRGRTLPSPETRDTASAQEISTGSSPPPPPPAPLDQGSSCGGDLLQCLLPDPRRGNPSGGRAAEAGVAPEARPGQARRAAPARQQKATCRRRARREARPVSLDGQGERRAGPPPRHLHLHQQQPHFLFFFLAKRSEGGRRRLRSGRQSRGGHRRPRIPPGGGGWALLLRRRAASGGGGGKPTNKPASVRPSVCPASAARQACMHARGGAGARARSPCS